MSVGDWSASRAILGAASSTRGEHMLLQEPLAQTISLSMAPTAGTYGLGACLMPVARGAGVRQYGTTA
jgi:hypothetical protein